MARIPVQLHKVRNNIDMVTEVRYSGNSKATKEARLDNNMVKDIYAWGLKVQRLKSSGLRSLQVPPNGEHTEGLIVQVFGNPQKMMKLTVFGPLAWALQSGVQRMTNHQSSDGSGPRNGFVECIGNARSGLIALPVIWLQICSCTKP